MTSRTTDFHCRRCHKYLFSSKDNDALDKDHYCRVHEPRSQRSKKEREATKAAGAPREDREAFAECYWGLVRTDEANLFIEKGLGSISVSMSWEMFQAGAAFGKRVTRLKMKERSTSTVDAKANFEKPVK